MFDFKSKTAVFLIFLATCGYCFPVHAQDTAQGGLTTDNADLPEGTQQLPKWELALGIGATRLPHYPGSASARNFVFPAVIPLYRGEYLKFDDDGLRGEIYKSDRFDLDFSVDFNLAVDSSDVEERLGMPDLDNIIQIGPSLEWILKNDDNDQWLLKLGLRAAVAVDGADLNSTGFTANPQLTWYRKFEALQRDWRLGVTGGLLFGTEKYHDFYYQVSPEFVTAQRTQYDASGGYGGFRGITTLVSRSKKSWIALFARYENYSGAINEDSDLLPSSDGLTFGFVYSRFLFRSKTLVTAER